MGARACLIFFLGGLLLGACSPIHKDVHVYANGVLRQGNWERSCSLGFSGVCVKKREGDGCTPSGQFLLRRVWYRADRVPVLLTGLPARAIRPQDIWVDDSHSPFYNTAQTLPSVWRHERLWRDDGLYDLVVELGYNDHPVRRGAGSAIFMHVQTPSRKVTAGCVGLAREDLLLLVTKLTPDTKVVVHPHSAP